MPNRTPFSRLAIGGMVLLAAILLLALAAPALAFPDVPAGHAYEAAIDELSSRGIIGGYTNGNFGLNDPVKRAQFAKMIVGTLDITPNTSTATRFTDLGTPDANGYPHKYVQTAYEHGITTGTNQAQTLFAPSNSIRRDQVVSMIVRGANNLYPGALQNPPVGTQSQFDGVGEPHGNNLRIAEYNGLLDGLMGMGPYWSVTGTATRGEVAQMLWNLLNVLGGGPPPTGEVWVYVDGTGDYPTIEAAVDGIDPGTVINLGPGTFNLTKTITVDFDFDLVGNGMDGAGSTTVRYPGTVVDVYGATFSATDIRFVSTATTTASDVMSAEDAEIYLTSCYFTGGNRYNNVAGDGLYLFGFTVADVTDCVFTLNDLNGVDVSDDSDASLGYNECSSNGSNGIGFWDSSVGDVYNNTCNSNTYNGIQADDDADITAEDNECSENGSNGISFWGDAIGEVNGNICDSNDYNGIGATDNADVTAKDNDCWYNGASGIRISGYAVSDIDSNSCEYNSHDGISVLENADATVTYNLCLNNTEAGIWFGDFATGSASNNECAGNHWGIYVDATSFPVIYTSNYLHNNTFDYFEE